MYNALELLLLIFFTFSKFSGLYFYSLLVSSICVIPYALGFLFKFLSILSGDAKWFSVTLITIGWYGMVTGQSVVLWSRLHLLVDPGPKGQWTLKWTKWMIVVDAIILHIPTTVLTYGSNGSTDMHYFVVGYNVMEKIQMCGFFIQECILSTLYIVQAAKLLRNSTRDDAKKFLIQLVLINVLIIVMDLGILATEAASLYLYETVLKGTIYSIKLKLEFAVLGKLINFVGRPGTSTAIEERWRRASVAYMGSDGEAPDEKRDGHDTAMTTQFDPGGMDLNGIVDLTKVKTHLSHGDTYDSAGCNMATAGMGNGRKRRNTVRSTRGFTEDDVDIARFEHDPHAELPQSVDNVFDVDLEMGSETEPG